MASPAGGVGPVGSLFSRRRASVHSREVSRSQPLVDCVVVVTGTLPTLGRKEAEAHLRELGRCDRQCFRQDDPCVGR